MKTIPLGTIAHARSGDKGNHANVGVVAYTPAGYELLVRELTAERVQAFFEGLGITRVERFELPRVGALNFVLYNALAGGASQSLRIDTQGKLLGHGDLGAGTSGTANPRGAFARRCDHEPKRSSAVADPAGQGACSRRRRHDHPQPARKTERAFAEPCWPTWSQAFADLHLERRVRAVILTATGSTFCAGMDLAEMAATSRAENSHSQWHQDAVQYRDLIELMLQFPKPIIAAVAGPALAGGAGLMLACDIVVAGTSASFGLPEPKRGLVAGVVAPLVAFRVGAGRAGFLLLTAATIGAERSVSLRTGARARAGRQGLGASRRYCQPLCRRCARGPAAHQADFERNDRRAFGDAVVRRRGRQRHRPHDRGRRRRIGRLSGKAPSALAVSGGNRPAASIGLGDKMLAHGGGESYATKSARSATIDRGLPSLPPILPRLLSFRMPASWHIKTS